MNMNSAKRSPSRTPVEVSPLKRPIVLAVMGTAGGVGKGMFVWCTADLLSAAGYNVAIVDLDLMTRARTLEAQRMLLNVAAPVKTVYDHFATEAVGEFHNYRAESIGLWDVTPGGKGDGRIGRIHVLPAAFEEDILPYAVVAQLPLPQEPKAKEIIHSIIKRIQKELPSIQCIILECGAGQHLHDFAGFANANAGFILLDPREVLFEIARLIPKSYAKTYPEIKLYEQPIYYILNRYTSDEDVERVERAGIALRGTIPHNPVYQKYNITHPANFDAGFDDIYMAVYRTHLHALERWIRLPSEAELVTSRWWNGFKREHVSERTLQSGPFRVQTLLWWSVPILSFIGFLVLMVTEVIRYTESRLADTPFQLKTWLLFLILAIIGGSIKMLIQQERRRRALKQLERLEPEDEKRFLNELLREENKTTITWLNGLYRASQAKNTNASSTRTPGN